MAWTKAQQAFMRMALTPPTDGFSLDIVRCEHVSGVTRVISELASRKRPALDAPLVVNLHANRPWNAITELSDAAGTSGVGYTDRLKKALKSLATGGHVSLTVILESAEKMSIEQMDDLISSMEYAARKVGVSVRACMLCRPRDVKDKQTGQYVERWAAMPTRFSVRLKIEQRDFFYLTREGLMELRRGEIENSAVKPHERRAALAS